MTWKEDKGFIIFWTIIGILFLAAIAMGFKDKVASNTEAANVERACHQAGYADVLYWDDAAYCVRMEEGKLVGIPLSVLERSANESTD